MRKFFNLIFLLLVFFFVNTVYVYAVTCGNGSCQPSKGEDCITCPIDCGACVTPTTPPAPTPTNEPTNPTPTNEPTNPTPTSPNIPTSSPSNGGTSGTTSQPVPTKKFYPSINFFPAVPRFTNSSKLIFLGSATIEEGTVDRVEYKIDQEQWKIGQLKDNKFSFTVFNLSEGNHKVTAKAISLAGIASAENSQTFTVILTPPKIILEKFPQNPTKKTTPEFSATVTSIIGKITRVEISIDGEKSWKPMKLEGKNQYKFTSEKLEDGDYFVSVRAFDNATNSSKTEQRRIIVDTIPPMIGGAELSDGPQILTPNTEGVIKFSTKSKITVSLSMKGGVNQALIKTGEKEFPLTAIPESDQWTGVIEFDKPQESSLEILAIDSANNQSQRQLGKIVAENYGVITDKKTKKTLKNVKVSLFYFSKISNSWVLWEADSYGQTNAQKTDDSGSYSFMVPKGTFYLEAKIPGYKPNQSEIFNVDKILIINTDIQMETLPSIRFRLPIIGEVKIVSPNFFPPSTFKIKSLIDSPKPKQIIFKKISLSKIDPKIANATTVKNKKTLITFFSTWSVLSQEQVKILSDSNKFLTEDQSILGISVQESKDRTELFMKRGNYKFPIVIDENGEMAKEFSIEFLPHHFIVNSKGIISEILFGLIDKKTILNKLNNLD